MRADLPSAALSVIDEARFGIRTARAAGVTAHTLPSVLDFCAKHNVVLLIARVPATDLQTAQSMERLGFSLMDVLVYFSRDLNGAPIPPDANRAVLRPVRPGEEEEVRRIAEGSFRGYAGHYHADPRLDKSKCDEAYTDWAYRSCISSDVADQVIVAVVNESLAGFATLRLNGADEGEGILFGVAPFAQGRGIYRSFMVRGMEWCLANGAKQMLVSTQLTNIAVQKVWARLGFEPSHAYYTFHKWFDKT
jgi:GNAT superfamily N-acetyltransferase